MIFPYINILGNIGNNHPNWRRGRYTTNQIKCGRQNRETGEAGYSDMRARSIFMIMIMCNSAPPYESEERGETLSLLESSKASTLACNSWCAASQLGNMTGKRLGGQGRRTIIEYHWNDRYHRHQIEGGAPQVLYIVGYN